MWTLYNMASMGALRVEERYESSYERRASSIISEEKISNTEEDESVKKVKPEAHVPSPLETVMPIVTNANKEMNEFFEAICDNKEVQEIKNIKPILQEVAILKLLREKIEEIDLNEFKEVINSLPQKNEENDESFIKTESILTELSNELENRANNANNKDDIQAIEKLTEELEKRRANVTYLQTRIKERKAFLELTELLPERYKDNNEKLTSANKIKDWIVANTSKDFSAILKNLDLNDIELIYSEQEYQNQFGLYGFTYSGNKLDEKNLDEALIVRLKEIIKDASYEQIEKIKSFEKFTEQLSEEIKQRKGYLDLVNTKKNPSDSEKSTEEEIKTFVGKILEELSKNEKVNIERLLESFDPKEIGFLINRMQPLIDTSKFYYDYTYTISNEGLFKFAVAEHLSNLIKNAETIEALNDIKSNIPENYIYKDIIDGKENELKATLDCPAEFKEVFEKVKKISERTRELTYEELKKLQNEALRKLIELIYNNHQTLSSKIDERIKFIEESPTEVVEKYKEASLQIADKFKGSNVKFDPVFDDLKTNNDAIMLFATNPKYCDLFASLEYTYKNTFNKLVATELKNIIQNANKDTIEYIEQNAIKEVKNAVNDSISIRKIRFKNLKEVTDDLTKDIKTKFLVQYIERIKGLVPDASEGEIKALYKLLDTKETKSKIPVELTKMNNCIIATKSLIKHGKLPETQKPGMNKLLYNAKNAEEFLWSLSKDQLGYIVEDCDNRPVDNSSSAIGYVFEKDNSRMNNLYTVFGNYSNDIIEKANRVKLNDIKDRFLTQYNDVFNKNQFLSKKCESRNIELTQEETNSKLIDLNEKYKDTEYKDAAKIISEKLKDTIDHGMRDIVVSISQTDEQKYLIGTDPRYLEILKKCNRKTKFDNNSDPIIQNKDPEDLIKDLVSSYFQDLINKADNKENIDDIVSKLIDPLKIKLNDEIQKKKNEFDLEDNFKLATDNPKEFFKEENDIEVAAELAEKTKNEKVKTFYDLIKSCTSIPELLLLKKYDVYKKYYEAQNDTTYQEWQLKDPFVEQIKLLVPTSSLEDMSLITAEKFGKDIHDSLKKYIDARAFIQTEYSIMKIQRLH